MERKQQTATSRRSSATSTARIIAVGNGVEITHGIEIAIKQRSEINTESKSRPRKEEEDGEGGGERRSRQKETKGQRKK